MENHIYRDMLSLQEKHWWFKARRDILSVVIKALHLPEQAAILEIGCGAGGNLRMLKLFGQVSAMETDTHALTYAEKISGLNIAKGSLPNNIPYCCQFDLICLFDVLEHIKNDMDAVRKTVKYLNTTGRMVISVPAHMFLYGSHDQNMHHFRRYSKIRLKKIINCAGLKIQKISYFNTLLFPVVALTRCLDAFRKNRNAIGYNTPHPFLNKLLYKIFKIEKEFINIVNLPIGTSLIVICQKDESII